MASAPAELELLLETEYRRVISSDESACLQRISGGSTTKVFSASLVMHFKNLIKSPGLNNAAIAEVFVGLIDRAFKNYRSFPTSGDLKIYRKSACGYKSKLTDALNKWIPRFWGNGFEFVIQTA